MDESVAIPRWIQWMPGGVHDIVASQGGKAVRKRVLVNPATAAVAQQALLRHTSAGRQRPFLDFDHLTGQAAAWVQAFEWRDEPEPGVYVEVEWSAPGREAITGKAYRAFSPAFFVDSSDPARVSGLPFVMGGLVNDPAFRAIQPLWAKAGATTIRLSETMNKRNQLIALLGAISALQQARSALAAKSGEDNAEAIQAKDSEIKEKILQAKSLQAEIESERSTDTSDPSGLKVEINDATAALQAKDGEIADLRAKVAAAEKRDNERAKSDADAAVKAAVDRGAIPPANTELQAKWRETIQRDPTAAALLASLQPAQALTAGRVTQSADGRQVQITREDSLTVLKAYAAEPDPSKRGSLYGREIRARIERDEPLPINAATNTLGTLAVDLVSQRALDLLILQFPMLSAVTTDFSSEPVKKGKKVTTRVISIPTVGTYHTTNGYVSQDTTTTDVDVTLDQHKYVQHEFNADELSGTTRNLFQELAPSMAYALGKEIVDSLYALTTAANYTNTAITITSANFDRAGVIKIAKALTVRGVPGFNRTLLLNPDYFAALHEDAAIVSLAAYQNASVITNGQMPQVHGFKVVEAVNLPTTGNLTGFGAFPSAWAMIARLPSEYVNALPGVTGGGVVNTITEPNTGLSVQQVLFVNHLLGKAYSRIALLYGVAKGDISAGQRLISAAP